MPHPIVLSPAAILDIDKAFDYYNSRSFGLGYEFTDTLDAYFRRSVTCLPLPLSGTTMSG